MQDSERAQEAKCGLCGEPMPEGEEMFKFHGYSGGCPKPPLAEVAKYLGSMLAVDPPPSGASPQAETLGDAVSALWRALCEGDGKHSEMLDRSIIATHLERYAAQKPALVSPVEPELPTRLAICDVCVTAAHCSQHWRCLAECKPNDLRVKTNPCVWRITTGPLGTWVKPTCVEGSIPAPWGTERAKACHLCGAPLKVER